MIKKTVFIVLVVCFMLYGCSNSQVNMECCYENMEECNDMKNILADDLQQYHIADIIKEHSVKIKNQKVTASEYEITLDEYFYNKNTGVTGFKYMISNSDGSQLTEEQYKKLTKIHDNGELYLENGRSSRIVVDRLQRDKENHVVWYNGFLLSAISPQDKVYDITKKESLDFVEIYFMNNKIGKNYLPCYDYEEESIEFDLSENKDIVSIKMTEAGVSIIWNIDKVLSEFREMIKQLPAGEDPERYNYTVYKNIIIHLKDGKKYNVLDSYCDEEIREENKIASFSAVWKNSISLDEIVGVEIDGVFLEAYFVRST